MNYKLLNKKFGLNPSLIEEFSLEEKILDFACDNNSALYFLTKNKILRFKDSEIEVYGNCSFNCATSIQWHRNSLSLYVTDDGGRNLVQIPDGNSAPIKCFDKNERNFMDKYLEKYPNELFAKSKVDKYGNVYCMVKEANRVFYKSNTFTTIRCLVGNGFAAYSQSALAGSSSLNFPNDIDVWDKTLYIADSGNHIIRTYNGGPLKTIIGHPLRNTIKPSRVLATKDILYYVSNNVYTANVNDYKHSSISIYKPIGDVLIANNEQEGSLYILEPYAS